MGRPYLQEINRFRSTFEWGLGVAVNPLESALRRASLFPLVAVGSGGALTAAHFLATWHRRISGRLSAAMTPAEATALGATPSGSAVVILSAGGENKDINSAFRTALAAEPPILVVITAAPESRLAIAARGSSLALEFSFDVPAGRDGFLATNSLLAFCLLAHRCYVSMTDVVGEMLPASYELFLNQHHRKRAARNDGSKLWEADSIAVLHGFMSRPAAVDFESKCTEAALAKVQIADYRNFAHGRHHWLAKHPQTALLALSTPEERSLAKRTVALLPKSIPVMHLTTDQPGMLGGLRLLLEAMLLINDGGQKRGIDPGRPGVPDFGRKLYSLSSATSNGSRVSTQQSTSIARKLGRSLTTLQRNAEIETWQKAYNRARAAIENVTFAGIVFDYDGTLVDAPERYTGPTRRVTEALQRLLSGGVPVGIATGRGQSVGRDLRNRLDRTSISSITIGYYNGGDIAPLEDDTRPNGADIACDALQSILAALRASPTISTLARITVRYPQLSVEVHCVTHSNQVWDSVQGIILRSNCEGARAVASDHSIDILAPGVSKLVLVEAIRRQTGEKGPILRIGDRARPPGNDEQMLAGLDGLSVNDVSADPEAAWNFAPPGCVGVSATLAYLDAMVVEEGMVRLPDFELLDGRYSAP